LEEVESLLLRMIAGVFRFTFVRTPRFLYDLVVRCLPWGVKIARVLILLVIWVAIVFGPAYWVYVLEEQPTPWAGPLGAVVRWFREHRALGHIGLTVWTVLALAGSVWGAIYIRRRIRRKRATAQ
jgi:hypothetical protein